VLFGKYDLNRDFDVLVSSGVFLGAQYGIGTDISQTGANGPSVFPVTSLSLRLATEWNERWTTRFAILDGVPGDPKDPGKTTIYIDFDEGALLIGELARDSLNTRVLFGAWGYTAKFDNSATIVKPLPGDQKTEPRRGNVGAYVRGEVTLHDNQSSNVALFGRLGSRY
jgi:porin